MTIRCAALLGLLLAGVASGVGGPLSPERRSEILQAALRDFDSAAESSRRDAAEAERLYRAAAAGFGALADSGIRSATLQYNLGNTFFRLGDRGRAILHYRRGLAIEPGHAALRANLDYVRGQVTPLVAAPPASAFWRTLLFWHYDTSLSRRFVAAVALATAGWLGLLVLVLRRGPRRPAPLVALAVLLAACGAISAGSVIWQLRAERRQPAAVIVAGEPVLRLGRGESYEPAMREPLGSGVELQILSERLDWLEVRLSNGHVGWVPASGVERV